MDNDKRNDPNAPEHPDVSIQKKTRTKEKDRLPGGPTTNDSTEISRARKKRTNMMLLFGGVAVIGFLIAFKLDSPKPVITKQKGAPAHGYINDSPVKGQAKNETLIDTNKITVSPKTIDFGQTVAGQGHHFTEVHLSVESGSYQISSVAIPYGTNTGFTLDGNDCLNKTMKAGQSCSIAIGFNPTSETDSTNISLSIQGTSYGSSTGASSSYSTYIPLKGKATNPPPPPPPAENQNHDAPNPFDRTGSGNQNPFQKEMDQKKESEEAAQKAAQQEAQKEYLAQNDVPSGSAMGSVAADSMGGQNVEPPVNVADMLRPMETKWQSNVVESSYPYDMTRLISMGTPIPAVIKYTIDSRYPTKAVATVERDIYGEDGRDVIIERGSEIIGTASSGGGGGGGSGSSGGSGGSGGSGNSETSGGSSNEKMTLSWNRIRRPDGVIFKINGTSGDAMGRGGITSLNDDRPWDRFGAGLVSTILETIGVGATGGSATSVNTGGSSMGGFSAGGSTATSYNSKALAAMTLQQGLTPLAQEYSSEHLSIPVIRLVPAGTRFTIFLQSDIELRPIPNKWEAEQMLKATHSNSSANAPPMAQQPVQQVQNSPQYQYPGTPRGQNGGYNPYGTTNSPNPYAAQNPQSNSYGPPSNLAPSNIITQQPTMPMPNPQTQQGETMNDILRGG